MLRRPPAGHRALRSPFRIYSPALLTWSQDNARADREKKTRADLVEVAHSGGAHRGRKAREHEALGGAVLDRLLQRLVPGAGSGWPGLEREPKRQGSHSFGALSKNTPGTRETLQKTNALLKRSAEHAPRPYKLAEHLTPRELVLVLGTASFPFSVETLPSD